MKTAEFLQTFSDAALEGAIRQLAKSREWPWRLKELRRELERRKTKRRSAL